MCDHSIDLEVWRSKLGTLLDEYRDEVATRAYHGDLCCRRHPNAVRADINDMLLSIPMTIGASTHEQVLSALDDARDLSGPPHERIAQLVKQRLIGE